MDEMWFEEELFPVPLGEISNQSGNQTERGPSSAALQTNRAVRGILRVDKPRWAELDVRSHKILSSDGSARFYLVRLGFQFDLTEEARSRGARFVFARCAAYLWPAIESEPQPTVYEVIPRHLYEGEPTKVNIKIGPEIKLGEAGGSLGEVSTEITIGVVEPVTEGWPGQDERAPYWEIRPKNKVLLGVRHMWMIIEAPLGCRSVRLATIVNGEIQTYLGLIPIGPRSSEWARRPSLLIG